MSSYIYRLLRAWKYCEVWDSKGIVSAKNCVIFSRDCWLNKCTNIYSHRQTIGNCCVSVESILDCNRVGVNIAGCRCSEC